MVALPQKIEQLLGPGDRCVVFLILIGIILYMASMVLSYVDGSWEINKHNWKGFSQKMNWLLFPLFFLLLGFTTIWVMRRFRYAWRSLATSMTIFERKRIGKMGYNCHPIGIESLDGLLKTKYAICSRYICLFSILIGVILSFVEAFSTFTFHFPSLCEIPINFLGDCNGQKSTCSWILFDCGMRECWVEKDFSIYGAHNSIDGSKHILWSTVLMIITQVMQSLLIAIAFILLLQIVVNICVFGYVSLLPFHNSRGIGIKLNSKDDMGEFGISAWNSALNVSFFVIAITMLIPILSSKSQPSGDDYDFGQSTLSVLLPLIVLIPILLSFIVRTILHSRLKKQFYELEESEKKGFCHQDIWPFNKNVVSKVLITIILSEYYFAWDNFKELEEVAKLIGL